MNIGIDFDGVLFDTESAFRAMSQMYNLKLGGEIVDMEKLRFQERYNWTWEQCKQFMSDCMLDIHKKAQIMPCAKAVINALGKHHNIYAITSRGLAIDGEIEITNNRLQQEGIKFDQIIYNCDDKLEACKQLNIDLMIEDWDATIIKLADTGIKCFYYKDNVCNDYAHNNVVSVRDWGDIAVELVNMGLINIDDIEIM